MQFIRTGPHGFLIRIMVKNYFKRTSFLCLAAEFIDEELQFVPRKYKQLIET